MKLRQSRGFTLLELLVVIAIIAILAAILFPVFAQAREKARQATCASNMRQTMLGISMYAQDYDELFPAIRYGLWGYNAPTDYGWGMENQIHPYLKNMQILKCPSDAIRRLDTNSDGKTEPISYSGTHYWAGRSDPRISDAWGIFGISNASRSLASIQEPADTVALYELWMYLNEAERYSYYRWFNHDIYRWRVWPQVYQDGSGQYAIGAHSEMTNFAFADGHVKAMRTKALCGPGKNLLAVDKTVPCS